MRWDILGLAGALLAGGALVAADPVTVAELVERAQRTHPTAAAIAAARAAADAQVRQAAVWSNPELSLNLGRTRPRVADLERDHPYGGSLSQRLSWWGKRNARAAAARAQQQVADATARVAWLGLHADVRRAAIQYAAAWDGTSQADEEARLAADLAAMTEARAVAGDADRSSVARARLEATTSALQRDTSRREAATALAVLRTWCDQDLPDGLVVADAWTDGRWEADAAEVSRLAERHPQLQAIDKTMAAAAAALAAEQEAAMPDLAVGVFADREADKDTYGLTLGFELPLWDRNQGGIAAAEAARAQAHAAARLERIRLRRDLTEAMGAAQAALAEAAALREDAAPAADEAIRLRTAAYRSGEASLADLLEARRAANAVRAGLRDARRRAALALVDLGLAVGDPALGIAPGATVRP